MSSFTFPPPPTRLGAVSGRLPESCLGGRGQRVYGPRECGGEFLHHDERLLRKGLGGWGGWVGEAALVMAMLFSSPFGRLL